MHIDKLSRSQIIEQIKENRPVHWDFKKDTIEICRECGFRYMCNDSEMVVVGQDGARYRKAECDYNPYIDKWKGDKDYLSLKEMDAGLTNESI
ncbi:MAG: hypothetical protein ACI8ZM_001316 [Crocinitomix sp.]|jgi:hypothetical protein